MEGRTKAIERGRPYAQKQSFHTDEMERWQRWGTRGGMQVRMHIHQNSTMKCSFYTTMEKHNMHHGDVYYRV